MTPLAVSLKPYLTYIIFALIFFLSLSIFIGSFLIIRRLWKKEPVAGALIQDRERLAAEIHTEILRLEELRNRLDPNFKTEGREIQIESTNANSEASSQQNKDNSNSFSESELEARVKLATEDLMKEIAELTAKLNQSSSENSSEEAHDQAKVEIKELKAKLDDYRAFEDELALVKKYKTENEALLAQLKILKSGGTVSEEDARISTEEIASLFEEMESSSLADNEPNEESESPSLETAASEENEAQIENEPSLETSGKNEISEENENIEPITSETEDPSLIPAQEDNVVLAEASEPSIPTINDENAEAMAELGDDQDELMAEFEKVLGTKDQEKIT